MEEYTDVHTAQDLLEFLQSIPRGHREVLPLEFIDGDGEVGFHINHVEAFRTFDGEGNEERGFRLSGCEQL